MKLVEELKYELETSDNKISKDFIKRIARKSYKDRMMVTPNMKVCIFRLETGYEILGVARLISPEDKDSGKGDIVAYDDAVKQLREILTFMASQMLAH